MTGLKFMFPWSSESLFELLMASRISELQGLTEPFYSLELHKTRSLYVQSRDTEASTIVSHLAQTIISPLTARHCLLVNS